MRCFFMAMIANLPTIERILVTGDQYQLPSYSSAVPGKIISLRHEGAIEKLIGNSVFRCVSLNKNFRSHPILVEALSVASYNGQLVPERTSEKRHQWRVLGFPTPTDSLPVLTLQTTGWKQLTLERSWSSDLHNEATLRLRRFIVDKIPSAPVVLSCYYSTSVARITALDPESQVFSINRHQDRDCDSAIIVTTRITQESVRQNVDFVLDP